MAAAFRSKKPTKPKTRRLYIYGRYIIISILVLIITGLCILFLLNTTVIHVSEWRQKGNSTLRDSVIIPPLRGEILAADGSILATNVYYYNVRLDFKASRLDELNYKESLDSLADTLAVYHPERTRQEWYDHLYKPLTVPKEKRKRNYLLLKHITREQMERVRTSYPYFRRSRNRNRTGMVCESELLRRYPYGTMANLSIGRVGQTAECSEIHGISGLEMALDTMLFGKSGLAKQIVFTRGVSNWPIKAPQNGTTITTTIDITVQDLLEHELGSMVKECKADWGSAMIMEVATGDIKAISNLDRDTVGNRGYIEAMNHIVQAYEPGSVIKVISMLTALEDGYVNLNQVYGIGSSYAYAGGKPIRDTHSPAALPVSRFMEYSSNIGMTKLIAPRWENNLNGFRERLREIGFFDRLGTGMANERPPHYPTLDVKAGGRVSLSRMIFGYSTQVPPLYTCAIYNAIANDGKFVRPRLVKGLKFSDGRDSVIDISYVRQSICSPRNAAILREMMHSVVWGEGGTAKGLKNDIVEIAGKTGTAGIALERPRDKFGRIDKSKPFKGGYREGKHNRVAFCGFFPYKNPKYTCIVVISDPKGPFGPAATSGTVLRNLALKMYARGMLGSDMDFRQDPVSSRPTLYGSRQPQRTATLHNDLKLGNASLIRTSRSRTVPHTVPDVTGLGIREALVVLEEAGLTVSFSGIGYVTQISPPPGTPVKPRTKVKVTLGQV